jgi:hypothetical protein
MTSTGEVPLSTRDLRIFSCSDLRPTRIQCPLTRRDLCCSKRIRQNPRILNGSVKRYPRPANLVKLPQLATAAFAEDGSAQPMLRTKRGIAAPSNRVMREARDNRRAAKRSSPLLATRSPRTFSAKSDWRLAAISFRFKLLRSLLPAPKCHPQSFQHFPYSSRKIYGWGL